MVMTPSDCSDMSLYMTLYRYKSWHVINDSCHVRTSNKPLKFKIVISRCPAVNSLRAQAGHCGGLSVKLAAAMVRCWPWSGVAVVKCPKKCLCVSKLLHAIARWLYWPIEAFWEPQGDWGIPASLVSFFVPPNQCMISSHFRLNDQRWCLLGGLALHFTEAYLPRRKQCGN